MPEALRPFHSPLKNKLFYLIFSQDIITLGSKPIILIVDHDSSASSVSLLFIFKTVVMKIQFQMSVGLFLQCSPIYS